MQCAARYKYSVTLATHIHQKELSGYLKFKDLVGAF